MPSKVTTENIVVDIDKLIDFLNDADENGVKIITVCPVHEKDWDNPESPEYIVVFTT